MLADIVDFPCIEKDPSNRSFRNRCRNVMEALVIDEVEVQFKSLPPKLAKHIRLHEVTAYALNRLPSLYATSKRGWQRQWHIGKTELRPKIVTAVRQGIMAVQKDLLRDDVGLNFDEENSVQTALNDLKDFLQVQYLPWENLVDAVESALLDTMRGKITWRRRGVSEEELFDWEKFPHHQKGS